VAGPLAGLRVLDLGTRIGAPFCAGLLGEWGAEVIKIEHPETGDPQRGLVNMGLVPTGPGGINHMIELPNRGKKSVALDLKTDEGRDVLLKLAATCDVFVTSYLPHVRRSLRIEVDDIRAANPNIIYVRGSGQGQHGPEAEKGGYDGASFWARAVSDIVTKVGDWPVPPPGPAFGDMLGGMVIAGGICAALYHREHTGEALVVDNSLLGTAMWATAGSSLAAGLFGISKLPAGDRTQMFNPLVNVYKTADERFIQLMMLQADRFWPEFVTAIGHPELATDPRFAEGPARYEHRQECITTLDEIFATKTFDEWRQILSGISGVWAPVQTQGELLEDPQVLANDYVREVKHKSGNSYRIVGAPIMFDGKAPELTAAPDHGEHTDEVLLELGLDMDQIIELKVKGAIL
jgi:crotonobetainyl-CoA:carnitine CoA-transferase CaiB-like acyl-CoA transferase